MGAEVYSPILALQEAKKLLGFGGFIFRKPVPGLAL